MKLKTFLGYYVIVLLLWISDTTNSQVNICSELCRCVNESHFVKIHCELTRSQEYVLDSELRYPSLGVTLNITLGDKSRLSLKTGFFSSNNRINSLTIQGLNHHDSKTSKNQVLLSSHSLLGIRGNFPEITFKNINAVVLSEKSMDGLLEINLIAENIWQFIIHREVFGTTSFNASFSDIAELILEDGFLSTSSYNLTKPKMFINRSWLRNIFPMRGKKLTEFRIENSEIGSIKTSAFNVIEIPSIILDNVTIQDIESDIFREGIAIENLAVTNCKIEKIATKAINSIGISKFMFKGNTVNSIEEYSMEFVGSNIEISDNKINLMGTKWLKSNQWYKVIIINNSFGNFGSISLENPTNSLGDIHCRVHHNSITKIDVDGFKSFNEHCQFTEMIFKEDCSCNFHLWLTKLFETSREIKKLQSEAFCSLSFNDTLLKCLKLAETVKYNQYFDAMCNKRKSKIKCDSIKIDKIDAKFISDNDFYDALQLKNYISYAIIGAIAIISVTCFTFFCVIRRKSRNSNHYDREIIQNQNDLIHLNQSEGPPSYEASLRTGMFSIRDQMVIDDALKSMKQKQPKEKFDIVNEKTQRLLRHELNEYEKVKIIGDIVQTIGECENCGEDFVAFTDILYKHLAPNSTTRLRNQAPRAVESSSSASENNPLKNNNSEHIYAEPTIVMNQRTLTPLLHVNKNLSSSLHNENNEIGNLYSEPVTNNSHAKITPFKPQVITPYAISQAINPYGIDNLPDVVNKFEPGPSNEGKKNIPEYTVPIKTNKTPVRVTPDNIEDWSDEASMENSTSSNHSGGSKATIDIDEILNFDEYDEVKCDYQWGGTVCDCENSTDSLRLPNLHGNIRQIEVKHCQTFLVPAFSLENLFQVNGIRFEHIGRLDFVENSFDNSRDHPAIRLEIFNSTVPDIPSHFVKGNLHELIIQDSVITKIHIFALTGLSNVIDKIKFTNTQIGEIETQAFKKLSVNNVEFINVTFQHNSVSKSFYDCHAENIIIENSHFSMLQPSTFEFKEVNFLRIYNSTFGVLQGEAFVMDVADRAIFTDNNITMFHPGSLKAITKNPKTSTLRTESVYFELKGNNIDFIDPELDVKLCPNMKLQVSKLFVRDRSDCPTINKMYEYEFFSEHSNAIYMRVNDDFELISSLHNHCTKNSSTWIAYLVISLFLILILFIIVLLIFWCVTRRKNALKVIKPDPRTYRQTEIFVKVETTGLMKTDF
ncbi:CLUMA_CG004932, isoform A [Clunio marinus]|uniref:CLUMA_CG004932, isoform A n=1 Tax=Clunio marinus TaxID=568069 RepID=A0A1J1HV77_9DIPT|nr:CLUMA_CG004932, isoform A [Clunio marinus]